jgi:uncharacterized protein with FMN-binding domain
MSRNIRNKVANTAIVIATIVGGFGLTQHFAAGTTESVSASGNSSNTAKSSTTASANKTVTSVDVPYQFGDVQLTVTRANGKITTVDYGTSTASAGREQAFPVLVQAAISAQGTNFGNLSGATYTTDAFKQALSSAITKLG